MTLPSDIYQDADIAGALTRAIKKIGQRPLNLMEVCGTHTTSIFRHGIRSLLPSNVRLLSGPGCPVCVTAQGEIDAFVQLAERPDVMITTFGDLMRVPGSGSSLEKERAKGHDVRVVYSAMDALALARQHPDKKVVFLGVGFETTAPTIAAAITTAQKMGVTNFLVFSAHKIVPPALSALVEDRQTRIDGFILPGHVSVIIGLDAYRPFFKTAQIPSVVSGFEPNDILRALLMLIRQIETSNPSLENAYGRAVTATGNTKAQTLLGTVFETTDAPWRGIGVIPQSGLKISKPFVEHDAGAVLEVAVQETPEPKGCACGKVLLGVVQPPECALYKDKCTPMTPIGPCMVSTEGTCAAYYRYHSS
jgi:hydrogenase expression/formation protein HypD